MHEILIHLFNGDCAYEAWRTSGLPGETLVWRENYLLGVIPRTDDLHEFCRVRARELHRFAPDRPETEIFAELMRMNRSLSSLTEQDQLNLWFDICPFDRTMLARILYLLSRLDRPPQINLIRRDVVWDAEAFRRHRHDGVLLNKTDLQYGAAQWLAYQDNPAAADHLLPLLP